MEIQIMIFGQLTEIVNADSLSITDVADTRSLLSELNKRYPALADAKFTVAVDRKIAVGNQLLKEGNTVALLPPFSGG